MRIKRSIKTEISITRQSFPTRPLRVPLPSRASANSKITKGIKVRWKKTALTSVRSLTDKTFRRDLVSPVCQGTPRWVSLFRPWLKSTYCSCDLVLLAQKLTSLRKPKVPSSPPMTERWQQILIHQSPGLDAWDRERAEREAKDSSRDMYDQHYIDQNGANQYDPNEYSPPQHFQY